jgi:hypothetical protein
MKQEQIFCLTIYSVMYCSHIPQIAPISEYLICVALKEIRLQVSHYSLSADVVADVEKAVNA